MANTSASSNSCLCLVTPYCSCRLGAPRVSQPTLHLSLLKRLFLSFSLQVPAGPQVPARSETHIFNALGLHYVPPHMRGVDW